ncbi:hypothetical protein V5N11_030938 [Cardamine amara subsp. amara]|uniref:Reverse transcriptase zinc-binding domain-containing protein n=1 Tax=Cardamine amara subsp. amara TaxID=228776 RepID=A0ABD1BLC7_CARAN
METRNHIFFTCPYSAEVWHSLINKLFDTQFPTQWNTVLGRFVDANQENVKLFLLRYAFQIAIHSLWRKRNDRQHGEPATHHIQLTKYIDKQVRDRLSTIRAMGDTRFEKGMVMWLGT